MLGCEFGCTDAIQVLIQNGADVTLLDALGRDSSEYARRSNNLHLVNQLKMAKENTSKGVRGFL